MNYSAPSIYRQHLFRADLGIKARVLHIWKYTLKLIIFFIIILVNVLELGKWT